MLYSELFHGKAVVPLAGATVEVMDADGVVVAQLGLQPGLQSLKPLLQHFGPEFVFSIDCAVVSARGDRGQILVPSTHTDSGANSQWRPQRMTDNEARLMVMIRNVQARVDSIKGREKALNIARERQARAQEEPLLEVDPDPQAEPEPEPQDKTASAAE